jgi:hypothetical protein
VEVGGEQLGAVEAAAGDAIPRGAAEDAGVELVLPEDLEGVALGVVLEAGEAQEGGVAGLRRGDDLVDEVLAARTWTIWPGSSGALSRHGAAGWRYEAMARDGDGGGEVSGAAFRSGSPRMRATRRAFSRPLSLRP